MPQTNDDSRIRFWPLVALTLAVDLVITLVIVAVGPGFSGQAWSDALCLSAVFLGLISGIPFLLDAGRGLTLAGKMSADNEERRELLQKERHRREKGIRFTFALALAAFLIGLLSLLLTFLR